jgi:hypothetical protein
MQKAVPHFCVDPEWLRDNLTYTTINDFARYICSEAAMCSIADEIPRFELSSALSFLEEALRTGDTEVQNLIFECLDTLQACNAIRLVREHLGPKTKALLASLPQ